MYYNTDARISDKFGFNVIPATYIIDKKGDMRLKPLALKARPFSARLTSHRVVAGGGIAVLTKQGLRFNANQSSALSQLSVEVIQTSRSGF